MDIKIYNEVDFYKEMVKKLEAINLIFFEIEINQNAYYSIAWNDNIPQPFPKYLNYLCHLHIKTTTIESNKLLNNSNTENFNLYHLFNFIYINDLDHVFDFEKIKKFKNELKQHQKIIKEIKSLRVKRYAHLDDDYKKVENFFVLGEFRVLNKLLKEIVDYLNITFRLAPNLRYNSFKGYLFSEYYDMVFKEIDFKHI